VNCRARVATRNFTDGITAYRFCRGHTGISCDVSRLVVAGLDLRCGVVQARHASQAPVEKALDRRRGHMQRCLEFLTLRWADQRRRRFSSVTGSAAAFAATMNIFSVAWLASVAYPAMSITGKIQTLLSRRGTKIWPSNSTGGDELLSPKSGRLEDQRWRGQAQNKKK
jgi:hypothetical protein